MRIFFSILAFLISSVGCKGAEVSSGPKAPVQEVEMAGHALTGPQQIVLSFPAGVNRNSVVLAANGTLNLADRAYTKNSDNSAAAISNAGNVGTNIGVTAVPGNLTSVASVTLRDRAKVNGNLITAGSLIRQNNTVVTGTITQHATLTPLNTFSWSVVLPATNTGNVTVAPNGKVPLSPGSYGSVIVNGGGRLSLRAGSYFLTSLSVESTGGLVLDMSQGPIIMYVTNSAAFKGQIINGGGPATNFMLVYLGSSAIFVESPFVGTIVAPTASLTLASATHKGYFFAKDIELRPDGIVMAAPFPFDTGLSCETVELTALLDDCKVRCVVDGTGSLTLADCAASCSAGMDQMQDKANATCANDPDHDGVPIPLDKCPDTPRYSHVNRDGCPDDDDDGIKNPDDKCAGTPIGTQVDAKGCAISTTCKEGNCGIAAPICSGDECKEVPIQNTVPPEVITSIATGAIETATHPITCPGDVTAPVAPVLTTPATTFSAIELGAVTGNTSGVSVTMKNGKVASGDVVPLSFAWTASADPCPEVLYSVYLEYYHCHSVGNVNDMVSYLNAGWCEWQPHSYQTVSATTYQTNFEIGRVLLEMHRPFFTNLGWQVPTDGLFTVLYQPQWIRLRVYAHDGNGNTSAIDNEERYYVLYSKDLAIGNLNDIPMSPFR